MNIVRERREHGTPKKRSMYRAWKRKNAVSWKGVKPDRRQEHPELTKVRSNRGEVHYIKVGPF